MKGLLEYKNYKAEIKDMDSERMTVTGYFASFGNIDYDDDIIDLQSISESLSRNYKH